MKFEKRAYETRAVREIDERLDQHGKVLAVGPTGCGKTVIASLLIKQRKADRVLFLAHKYELVDQAHRRLADAGIRAGVWMAHDEHIHGTARIDKTARVQIASIQTAARRGVPIDPDLIVIDEAHRAAADSYQSIVAKFPKAKLLGLTATPCRQDGRGLADSFADIYIIAKPSALYTSGHLAKPRTFAAPPAVVADLVKQLKSVRTAAGDYNKAELEQVVDSQLLVGNVVSESIRLAPRVPKVVFAAGVKHSQRIAERFRRRGIKATHLDGNTPVDERAAILGRLASGDLEVVSNVDVLSEGWDLPALGAVVIARPTKSLARFLQMCGRVQRKYGNRIPLILDHGNNVLRHQVLPHDDIDWTLDNGSGDGGSGGGEPILYACPTCYTFVPTSERVCPECGTERPISERDRELKEKQAKLEEIRLAHVAEIRSRIETIASRKNAPTGWVARVLSEMLA
jgi:DNA repair protein RadD